MKGAGLTQGAFYKQFASKEDLSAQAATRALEIALNRWKAAAEDNPKDPLGEVLAFYLSMEHRAERKDGCPVAALGCRCCEARRRAKGVIRSRDQGTAQDTRRLDWRHASRRVQRQGNGRFSRRWSVRWSSREQSTTPISLGAFSTRPPIRCVQLPPKKDPESVDPPRVSGEVSAARKVSPRRQIGD